MRTSSRPDSPRPSLSERRSRALAALRRYYPGFFGAAFLVLLRLAIGWHLLSEGLYKLMSMPDARGEIVAGAENTREAEQKGNEKTKGWFFGRYFHPSDTPTFSSEAYNRNASGPLAKNFRSLIPDVDSRDALNLGKLKESWKADLDRIAAHYGFNDDQKAEAAKTLSTQESTAGEWFIDPDNRAKIRQYVDNLDSLERLDAKPKKMSFEVERYNDARKTLEADRKALVAPIDSWTKALRDSWTALATPEQRDKAGPYTPQLTEIQTADKITAYGLSLCGLLLMLGLLTPLAALGSAGFLALFYLSMPPWPGLPEGITEGHYRYVNKNLIEMLACLALAFTPSGLWIGIDAFLFGWIGRLGRQEVEAPPAERPAPQDRRKFKTR